MRALLCLALALVSLSADARIHRSTAAKHEFQRQHPCPSTGKPRGACPGYVIDHRQALCVGGRDEPANMGWQTIAAAKAKDRWECKPGWQQRLAQCESTGCFVR